MRAAAEARELAATLLERSKLADGARDSEIATALREMTEMRKVVDEAAALTSARDAELQAVRFGRELTKERDAARAEAKAFGDALSTTRVALQKATGFKPKRAHRA